MKLDDFRKLTLVRSFVSIDPETTHMVRHEVRRDERTGLTLTARIPQAAPEQPNAQHKGET